MANMSTSNSYNFLADEIKVLSMEEAVNMRPGMYGFLTYPEALDFFLEPPGGTLIEIPKNYVIPEKS